MLYYNYMPNSIENMTDRFNQLPKDAQKAIQMFDYDKALKKIHLSYKLHIDQASSLEKIIANIVFGEERSQEMVHLIEKELRLSNEDAAKIALDVNRNILMPIQNNMRLIQLEDTESGV